METSSACALLFKISMLSSTSNDSMILQGSVTKMTRSAMTLFPSSVIIPFFFKNAPRIIRENNIPCIRYKPSKFKAFPPFHTLSSLNDDSRIRLTSRCTASIRGTAAGRFFSAILRLAGARISARKCRRKTARLCLTALPRIFL